MRQHKKIEINKGERVRVITDLQTSDTFRRNGKLFIVPMGRAYSVSSKVCRNWRLNGHTSRLILSNVTTHNMENERLKVLETNRKKPHAFLDGDIQSHCISDEEHSAIVSKLLSKGAKYVSYDPYKVKGFVLIDTPHLPEDCSKLNKFTNAKLVYCFEDSVLAIL